MPSKKKPFVTPLRVRKSAIHGRGVFASRRVAAGKVLGVYAGRRHAAGVDVALDGDGSVTYLFGLSDGTTIDGSQGGNETRFLNHSCEPNAEAFEEWGDDDQLILKIFAIRTLRAEEEVFIDYCLTVDPADEALYRCHCGAAACRGSMASPGVVEP